MPFVWGMGNPEKEKALFAKYPFHIGLMVKAAKKALEEGRASIQDGILVFQPPAGLSQNGAPSVDVQLDGTPETKVVFKPKTD